MTQLAQKQNTATSPLGRVDLADFLGADRRTLTRELKRMQKVNLIQFSKSTYTLENANIM
ncbi:helix-turn-helix domain-containing protein [Muricomes intestini]|uniref:helix-turn-helix domain-containing protein n=1 Tax=Muricomes intestini TaxID=1796634 RepID=UPI003A5C8704